MQSINRTLSSTLENIRLAFDSLLSNRLRAFLTMLGITIGVAGVVVLLSVGQAFENFLLDRFNSIGTNLVALFGDQNEDGDFEPLTQKELDALSDPLRVPDTLFVVPFLDVSGRTASYENRETEPNIFGVTPSYLEVEQRDLAAGRYIDAEDMEGGARVAVIGSSAVENLFPPGVYPLGKTFRLGDIPFRVIGILEEGGNNTFADLDNAVFVPLSTSQSRLTNQRAVTGDYIVTQIIFKAPDKDSIDDLVQQITDTMREVRGIAFNGEDDFTISTQDSLLESIGTILRLLTYFLAAIASISLVVGGIGIMNIMLVTVTERTKEIGLRKAVGAKNSEILLQFVTEAVFISLLGGAVGIGIAAAGGALVTALVPDFQVVVDTFSVILAVGISSAIGVFFGYFPAQRAANLNPIDALRYE